jgi:hypothetical protein
MITDPAEVSKDILELSITSVPPGEILTLLVQVSLAFFTYSVPDIIQVSFEREIGCSKAPSASISRPADVSAVNGKKMEVNIITRVVKPKYFLKTIKITI